MLQWFSKKIFNGGQKTAKAVGIFLLAVFCFWNLFLNVEVVFAQEIQVNTTTEIQAGLDMIEEPLGLPATDIRVIIARIINVALGLLGIILVSIIIYGGYLYMTSGGNEEQIGKAKKILKNAVIGLAIILSAWAIVLFVMRMLGVGFGGQPSGPVDLNGYMNYRGSGALGRIVKDHYPERDQVDVPRNTKIVVTFDKPIAVNADEADKDTFVIDKTGDGIYGNCDLTKKEDPNFWKDYCDELRLGDNYINISVLAGAEEDLFAGAAILATSSTVDGVSGVYTIVIRPYNYLGSSLENVKYEVRLGKNIYLDDEANDYPSAFKTPPQYYSWQFTCGTGLDLTPPVVDSVWPTRNSNSPKNTVIQISFNEAVDPTGLQGSFTEVEVGGKTYYQLSGDNVYLFNDDLLLPEGNFVLTNGYRTLEFTPSVVCGVNACGSEVYCLPIEDDGDENTIETNEYELLLKAGETFTTTAWESIPFTGVMDMAANALDGNKNNRIEQATTTLPVFDNWKEPDNFYWNFIIENRLDLISPYLTKITPGLDAENISAGAPLKLFFSKRLRADSLYSIEVDEEPKGDDRCDVLYDQGIIPEDQDCVDELICLVPRLSTAQPNIAEIKHCAFLDKIRQYYFPVIDSEVEDVNMNCFYPGLGPGNVVGGLDSLETREKGETTGISSVQHGSTYWSYQGEQHLLESLVCYPDINSPSDQYDPNCTPVTTTQNISFGCNGIVSIDASSTESCLEEIKKQSLGAGEET